MTGDSTVKGLARETQRVWVIEVARRLGQSLSKLAVNSGMADVTLTRFVKEDYKGTLSALNIEKIKYYSGLPGPGELRDEPEVNGLSEGRPFDGKEAPSAMSAMVAAALAGRPNASPWLLQTDSLSSAGYHRDDVLIVDAAVQPRAGDIVAAKLTHGPGRTDIIFRVIEPPFLVGISNDPATRTPLPIDNNRVIVMGPLTECIRTTGRR